MNFIEIKPTDLKENVFDLFKNEACVTMFGTKNNHNALAIGWASLGVLWRENIATVYVKPTRYSFRFAEKEKYFSLMWFDEEHHNDLIKFFGTKSGRDINKDEVASLKVIDVDNIPFYEDAKLVIICEKIYSNQIDPKKIQDENVLNLPVYQDQIFHSEYIGKIKHIYVKNN